MKKYVILIVLSLALAAASASCAADGRGSDTAGTGSESTQAPEVSVTVTAQEGTTAQPETTVESESTTVAPGTTAEPDTQPETAETAVTTVTTAESTAPTVPETEAPADPDAVLDRQDPALGFVAWSLDTVRVNGEILGGEDGGFEQKLTDSGNAIRFSLVGDHEEVSFRGWIGFGQDVASFGYMLDGEKVFDPAFAGETEGAVKAAGGPHASRFEIRVPLTGAEAGRHTVVLLARFADGTVAALYPEVTVHIPVLYTDVGPGFPVRHLSYDEARYIKGSEEAGGAFTPGDAGKWDYEEELTPDCEGLKIWGWVALMSTEPYQFGYLLDGTTLIMDEAFTVPAEDAVMGVVSGLGAAAGSRMGILIDLRGMTGTHTVQPLIVQNEEYTTIGRLITIHMSDGQTEPVETEPVETEPVETEPVANSVFGAELQVEKAEGVYGINEMTVKEENGVKFVHFVPNAGMADPYYLLHDVPAGRFVSVRYRTTTENSSLQFYIGEGWGPSNDDSMVMAPLVADGQWHLLVLDFQPVIERGLFGGAQAGYVRVDCLEMNRQEDGSGKYPMPADACIDVEYMAFFDQAEEAAAYDAALR